MLSWFIKAGIFYGISFWGIYRHLTRAKIPFSFYVGFFIVCPFLQPNLFLNDLIITLCGALAVFYFANPTEKRFSTIISQFGISMLIYYLANIFTFICVRMPVVQERLGSLLGIVNFLATLISYAFGLILIQVIRPLLTDYFKVTAYHFSGLKYLFSLLFIPLSYFFYMVEYLPTILRGILHTSNLVGLEIFIALSYYIVTVLLFFVVGKVLMKNEHLMFANAQLSSLEDYTSELEVMYDDMRRFKHDYKNVLYSLKSALDTDNLDYAKRELARLTNSTASIINTPTKALGNLQNITNPGIKSVVYGKVNQAISDKLNVTLEVAQPIDLTATLNQVDALRVLSILLDNAIHAAKESKDKKIDLALYENEHAQFIVIGNSTKQEQLDLAELDAGSTTFNLNASHHIGLRNLRIVLAKYPQAINDRSSNNYWFEQRIILPKGEDK